MVSIKRYTKNWVEYRIDHRLIVDLDTPYQVALLISCQDTSNLTSEPTINLGTVFMDY